VSRAVSLLTALMLEQECTGAQGRWRIMWLTNDDQNRKCRYEILTIPDVAQSLMSLLLQGKFR
jgi:hypothetical protein